MSTFVGEHLANERLRAMNTSFIDRHRRVAIDGTASIFVDWLD
ncbi:MAG TPA: hypothetical protein VLM79_05880 [Kofleriaceae bacterium]|nr:hypothetical protein [Kofleriaceae bacterium]